MLLSYIRTGILYLVLILSVRLMGKRQVGQMEPAEFVVTMLVANLASIPMQDAEIPLYTGLVPILTVLGWELVIAGLSFSSVKFRKLLCGKPVILIENGKILQGNLRATRVSLDELTLLLREKEVLDLTTVQYAILETNGALSVFQYPAEKPASAKTAGLTPKPQYLPVTLIQDGRLLRENLAHAGKDERWVRKTVGEYRSSIPATRLLTVDREDHVYFLEKEGRP